MKQQINEIKRMQQLAGIIKENASIDLDVYLRNFFNERLLGGYLLDYNFDSPGMLILYISKEPSKPGQQTQDVEKLGTATYYPSNGKWVFDGPLKIEAVGNQQSILDKIAKLAGGLKESSLNEDKTTTFSAMEEIVDKLKAGMVTLDSIMSRDTDGNSLQQAAKRKSLEGLCLNMIKLWGELRQSTTG